MTIGALATDGSAVTFGTHDLPSPIQANVPIVTNHPDSQYASINSH